MSMEIDNLRVMKLRTYLMKIIEELKDDYEQLNINFLSNEPENYSLDKIPIAPRVEQWIIGTILQRDVYSFRSRMNYSADVISNIENIGFYETFEKIIKQKNENNDLPDIEGIQSISCLNCGTLNKANTNTAEFDIQLQIEYREV
jgi:hypothetical protein